MGGSSATAPAGCGSGTGVPPALIGLLMLSVVLVAGLPCPAAGQGQEWEDRVGPGRGLSVSWPGGSTLSFGDGSSLEETRSEARDRALNTVLSLAMPGLGQLRADRRRGWVYVAMEAAAWGVWVQRRFRGGTLRERYRDLAWQTGRLQTGPRVDGPFEYYETLSQWTRSGAFDATAAPGLQPETNPATFNGAVWSLARDLFFGGEAAEPGNAAYEAALGYYRDRAWGEPFLWDWTDDPAAQRRVTDLIDESDARFREATVVLGAVLANHLVSAIDAYLGTPSQSVASSVRIAPSPLAPGRAWAVSLHFGVHP